MIPRPLPHRREFLRLISKAYTSDSVFTSRKDS
jgi:hypothetical protein